MFVFSTPHRGFTCVHLFYSYLILFKELFPLPLNTSKSLRKHQRAVCRCCLYKTCGRPTSILPTALKLNLNSELHSEHTYALTVPRYPQVPPQSVYLSNLVQIFIIAQHLTYCSQSGISDHLVLCEGFFTSI